MNMTAIRTSSILLVTLLALTACGGGGNSSTHVSTATTGQELTDLKLALDVGAITQREYEAKRKEILNK
jgi:hypothetical protein